MDEAWRQRVRERAYTIWLREGSSDGSAEQFWLMAEEELLAEGQGPSSRPTDERPDRPRDEAQVDDAIDNSFPASDPPAGPARPAPARRRMTRRANAPSPARDGSGVAPGERWTCMAGNVHLLAPWQGELRSNTVDVTLLPRAKPRLRTGR
jgi:hypothetical protein